jgi:hypothetical protein
MLTPPPPPPNSKKPAGGGYQKDSWGGWPLSKIGLLASDDLASVDAKAALLSDPGAQAVSSLHKASRLELCLRRSVPRWSLPLPTQPAPRTRQSARLSLSWSFCTMLG